MWREFYESFIQNMKKNNILAKLLFAVIITVSAAITLLGTMSFNKGSSIEERHIIKHFDR